MHGLLLKVFVFKLNVMYGVLFVFIFSIITALQSHLQIVLIVFALPLVIYRTIGLILAVNVYIILLRPKSRRTAL